MDEVFKQYERLVYHIANQYSFKNNKEDLYQAGMIGLKLGLEHYDARKEGDMISYLCYYIKGEVLKEVNQNKEIRVGREMYSFQKQIKKAKEELTQELERYPTNEEIAYFLNEDVYKVIQAESLQDCVYHLDFKEEEENLSLYDKVSYMESGYDADILDLNMAFHCLSEEEQKLIYSRYYEDKTQSETAKVLGKTQVQVSRSEQKILKKMYTNMMGEKVA